MPQKRSDIKDLSKYHAVERAEEKYPWLPRLMDGATHELRKGKDFTVTTESMRSSLKLWAKRNGVNLVVRTEKGNLLIQAKVQSRKKPAARKRKR